MKRSGESPVILIKVADVFAAVLTALLLLPPFRANADDNGFIIDPTAKGEGYQLFHLNEFIIPCAKTDLLGVLKSLGP